VRESRREGVGTPASGTARGVTLRRVRGQPPDRAQARSDVPPPPAQLHRPEHDRRPRDLRCQGRRQRPRQPRRRLLPLQRAPGRGGGPGHNESTTKGEPMTTISRAGFRRKERGPDRGPFVHADGCPILRADPGCRNPMVRDREGTLGAGLPVHFGGLLRARPQACSARPARSEDQPTPAALRVRLRERPRCAPTRAEGQGRHGPGLLVGDVPGVRRLLAGSALRRERRVTTNLPPRCEAQGGESLAQGAGGARAHQVASAWSALTVDMVGCLGRRCGRLGFVTRWRTRPGVGLAGNGRTGGAARPQRSHCPGDQ
jgi:hypothetical protein